MYFKCILNGLTIQNTAGQFTMSLAYYYSGFITILCVMYNNNT